MKRKQLLIILFVSIILSSCNLRQIANRKIEDKLTGRWDILSISSSEKPDSVLQKEFDIMLHTLLINALIDFEKDHKFSAEIAGKVYSGKWEVDSKLRKIKLTEAFKESSYSLVFLKENEIQFSSSDAKQNFLIILKRPGHLEKSKK